MSNVVGIDREHRHGALYVDLDRTAIAYPSMLIALLVLHGRRFITLKDLSTGIGFNQLYGIVPDLSTLFKRKNSDRQADLMPTSPTGHVEDEPLLQFAAQLIAGKNADELAKMAKELCDDLLAHIIHPEIRRLIEEAHRYGMDVVLASGAPGEVANPMGELLLVDRVIHSRAEIVNGKYTGKIELYNSGLAKAANIVADAEENGVVLAHSKMVGDSIRDWVSMVTVGSGHGVNADRKLRKLLRQAEWPNDNFGITSRERRIFLHKLRAEIDPRKHALPTQLEHIPLELV